MRSRAVRVALFLLVVLAFGGAAYELLDADRKTTAALRAAAAFGDAARDVEASIGELRASTFAYVAMGQGRAFWTDRASTLLTSIGEELQKLQHAATSADARAALEEAAKSLATIARIDTSVRKYLDDEQHLLASDLVFADLREATRTAGARVADARQRELASLTSGLDQLKKIQAGTVAGAALFALLVLALLLPHGRRVETPAEPAEIGEPAERPVVVTAPAPAPAPPVVAPGEQAAGEVNLGAAAALCTDFARLRETAELPALLARAADLLDAAGVIVWLDDRASGELRPALSHGYSAHALARIHSIGKGDDNATAHAFRDGALRVVEADGLSNGAVAAPLVTSEGCVGVMAAEIRRGHERRASVQAMAVIIAAQMSTLVSAPADTPAAAEPGKG